MRLNLLATVFLLATATSALAASTAQERATMREIQAGRAKPQKNVTRTPSGGTRTAHIGAHSIQIVTTWRASGVNFAQMHQVNDRGQAWATTRLAEGGPSGFDYETTRQFDEHFQMVFPRESGIASQQRRWMTGQARPAFEPVR